MNNKLIFIPIFVTVCFIYGTYLAILASAAWEMRGTVTGSSNSLLSYSTFVYQHVELSGGKNDSLSFLLFKSPPIVQGNSTFMQINAVISTDPCNCDYCRCWTERPQGTFLAQSFSLLPASNITINFNASSNVKYYLFSDRSFYYWKYRLLETRISPRFEGIGKDGVLNYTIQQRNDATLLFVFVASGDYSLVQINASFTTVAKVYDVSKDVKKKCLGAQCNFQLGFFSEECVVAADGMRFTVLAREAFLLHFALDPVVCCGLLISCYLTISKGLHQKIASFIQLHCFGKNDADVPLLGDFEGKKEEREGGKDLAGK